MDTVKLEVTSRKDDVSAKDIRNEDMIPAVFYGEGKKNQHLAIDYQTFRKVFDKAGWNTVLELEIDGKKSVNVLVHDVQHDPVSDRFIHADFKFVDLNKEVTTEVPLVAVGESMAVKELGGTLQTRDMVTVRCMAKIIPHSIEFDITELEDFNSAIHIGDLDLPEGVEVLDEPELTVASVAAPRAEEEEEEEVAEDEEMIEGEEGAEGEGEEGEGKAEGEEGEKKEEGEKAEG